MSCTAYELDMSGMHITLELPSPRDLSALQIVKAGY